MDSLGLRTRYFTIGVLLSVLLGLLAYGFRTAPAAAARQLAAVTERHPDCHLPRMVVGNVDCGRILRPRLPPKEELTFPIYPGCENVADYEERVFCGLERLVGFIRQNQRQPEGSQKELVVASFTIDKSSGLMRDVRLERGEDPRNIHEALRVVNLLVERQVRWTPATEQGEPVDSSFGLPFSFHGAGCR